MVLAAAALEQIWLDNGLPREALACAALPAMEPMLKSSFHVGVAAQTSIAASALAAAEIWYLRTGIRQEISVNMHDAERECTGYFTIDGRTPQSWANLSGLYPCEDGHVRVHANFDHHRDGVLKILGLPPGGVTERDQVEDALSQWNAEEFETIAAEQGMVVSKVRSFDEWDRQPQAQALSELPLLRIERSGEAAAIPLSSISQTAQPLCNVRVLDLTRILAGPICGRTLAAYGADVMLVNSPNLPNIDHMIDTSRGKLSVLIDLEKEEGRRQLHRLLGEADILVQSYRPGGLNRFGFGPKELAKLYPGLVYVSLSAYGTGPWSARRGFDSLVQAATGFNHAEAQAAGSELPKAMPVQILDYASGFLMAFAAQAALMRRASVGGTWNVQVSLAQTAQWLRNLGRIEYSDQATTPRYDDHVQSYVSGFGDLRALPHAARFSATRTTPTRPSVPPGTNEPVWPDR